MALPFSKTAAIIGAQGVVLLGLVGTIGYQQLKSHKTHSEDASAEVINESATGASGREKHEKPEKNETRDESEKGEKADKHEKSDKREKQVGHSEKGGFRKIDDEPANRGAQKSGGEESDAAKQNAEQSNSTKAGPQSGEAAPNHGGQGDSQDAIAIASQLLEGNVRFVEGAPQAHQWEEERRKVSKAQHPRAIILTCSDSRVPPEQIFDQGLGDLFVVRTAGNVADSVAVGSMEYAAEHLHIKVLIILGHERCGAVTAAVSGEKMPSKNLETIMKKIAPSIAAASGWARGPALVRLTAETNTANTSADILKQSAILQKLVAEKKLSILRAMYDLDTGRVRPLP